MLLFNLTQSSNLNPPGVNTMYIWNYNGIQVFDIITVHASTNSVILHGIGMAYNRHFAWQAQAQQHGWQIIIISATNKRMQIDGSTFNLGLEVYAAAKRFLGLNPE
jgi:hypothetical protein